MTDIISKIPPMLSGEELIKALSVIPEYNQTICNEPQHIRLMSLSDIYNLYIPSSMSLEIYSKLYLAMLRSMQKKGSQKAIQQRYTNNATIINKRQSNGIMGGSDSFTIIGTSGIGKSSAINRAIELITNNQYIELKEPHTKLIPCLVVQCPFDSSVKGLLLEIIRKIDEELDSDYYKQAVKLRNVTTDMLIGTVSTLALNHIGLLIVDEIQNVVNSKNGKNLIGSLTQLINNSGISICMVGTPESAKFFEQAMQLARRSVGLQYTSMPYDDYFESFCRVLYKYQYVMNRTEITPSIIDWLYQHSSGVLSIVVALIHDAQEIAILNGKEILDIETLNEAYNERLAFLHEYIQPTIIKNKQFSNTKKNKKKEETQDIVQDYRIEDFTMQELVSKSKDEGINIVTLLKQYIPITEVVI